MLICEEVSSYKIIYSGLFGRPQIGSNSLKTLVGAAGLEPATLCLEGRCSIRLSYAPAMDSSTDSKPLLADGDSYWSMTGTRKADLFAQMTHAGGRGAG